MSLGELEAKINLDTPYKTVYGSQEPVKGMVVLTYRGNPKSVAENSSELFGPLILSVTLHGRAKTKIRYTNGRYEEYVRSQVTLFSRTSEIYNDAFRTQANLAEYIPFEMTFPEISQVIEEDYEVDGRFLIGGTCIPLPPSMRADRTGLGTGFEAFVEYRIGCTAKIPNIPVVIRNPDKDSEPYIAYDQPRPVQPVSAQRFRAQGSFTVQNEQLVPESQRKHDMFHKAMAKVYHGNFPTCTFDWRIDGPGDVSSGHPIILKVMLKPRHQGDTPFIAPLARLGNWTIQIRECTYVRSEKGIFSSHYDDNTATVKRLTGKPDTEEPFGEDSAWTRTLACPAVVLPSSFRTINIIQDYELKMEGSFLVAGETHSISETRSIFLHPPCKD